MWLLLLGLPIVASSVLDDGKPERWKEALGEDGLRFYDCRRLVGCVVRHCPLSKTFDARLQRCVSDGQTRRKRQSSQIGVACLESTMCGKGAYCDSTRRCACLSTFTEYNGYCWQKINPGESGCELSAQCSAVWPNAYCSFGACRCADGSPAFMTRDGPVCLTFGYCPVNGAYSKLLRADGTVRQCSSGLDQTCGLDATGYDCVCGDAQCSTSSSSFCCPGRALACIMAADGGSRPVSGGSVVTRWHHNPLTGNCERFTYRGAKGNANNFLTKDQCLSYCTHACSRGPPQYDPFNPPASVKGTVRFCSGDGGCAALFSCQQKGSRSLCCPKPSSVCSVAGALQNSPLLVGQNNFDPGLFDNTGETHPRWYYDVDEKQCKPFTYRGQSGNFNNFLSQAACDGYCAKVVCEAGEPLKDTSGSRNLVCSSSSACPSTHSCVTEGVCCPKKQHVCTQSKAVGTCENRVERFWYNARTRNCETFDFYGCQGNDNNFVTYEDCSVYCQDTNTAPQCPVGVGLKDSYGNFVVCGGSRSSQTPTACPANYLCFFDGQTYG